MLLRLLLIDGVVMAPEIIYQKKIYEFDIRKSPHPLNKAIVVTILKQWILNHFSPLNIATTYFLAPVIIKYLFMLLLYHFNIYFAISYLLYPSWYMEQMYVAMYITLLLKRCCLRTWSNRTPCLSR
jgi:hypothetical protein